MGTCGCGSDALEDQVADPALRLLLSLHSNAVRDFVRARRTLGKARRADHLLGEGAGTGDRLRAQAHAESSAELFRRAQQALVPAVAALGADRRQEMDATLGNGGLQRIAASARTRAVLALVEEDCSAAEAREALERLDAGLSAIGEIASADAAADYLNGRFGQLSDARAAMLEVDDSRRELCILILLIFSLYITKIVLLVISCEILLELGVSCDIANELEKWLRQMCPAIGSSG